jgi:hypothetical protein
MTDTISLVTLLAVLMLGLILWLYNSRQADALRAMARTVEDMHLVQLKNRHDARKKEPLTMTAMQWLEKQLGAGSLTEVIGVSRVPLWANLRAANGTRVVVSPLEPGELRKALKLSEPKRSRLSKAFELLLGDSPRNLNVIERSLRDEEWFDVEADQVGRQLGLDWGEVSRLWFYVIPAKVR